MKSYFQGIITGAVFTVSILIFMGQTTLDKQIKSQLKHGQENRQSYQILWEQVS